MKCIQILIINFVLNIGLVDLVCSTLAEEDIQVCAEGVYTWWPSVTAALFNYEGTAVAICIGTGSCSAKSILKQVSLLLRVIYSG